MAAEKKYYNIYHISECFEGSRISRHQKHCGLIEATDEEIKAFLEKWNRPRVYFNRGDKLYEHMVVALPVKKSSTDELEPYDPATRDWPDLPEGVDFSLVWNKDAGEWKKKD